VSDGPTGSESELVAPDDLGHPHNWPALPAVETVWSYVKRFESLEWIAWRGDTELGIMESGNAHVRNASSARFAYVGQNARGLYRFLLAMGGDLG
jgi:hypothetical protein